MLETGKLYLVQDQSTATNERSVGIEVNGNVDLMIYGTDKEESEINSISDMAPCLLENLNTTLVSTLSITKKYMAFIGTADYIHISDRKFKEIKPIS